MMTPQAYYKVQLPAVYIYIAWGSKGFGQMLRANYVHVRIKIIISVWISASTKVDVMVYTAGEIKPLISSVNIDIILLKGVRTEPS